MNYQIFTDKPTIESLFSSLLQEDDETLYVRPLSQYFSHHFSDDDFIVIVTEDYPQAIRMRRLVSGSSPFLLLLTYPLLIEQNQFNQDLTIVNYPFDQKKIRNAIYREKERKKTIRNLERYIIGHSEAMSHLRSSIVTVSQNSFPVHISGETGTGKSLSAKMIHMLGTCHKNMVYINCANLKTGLSDSDIFGHVKGAYTNASQTRRGLLEAANGSTLFLDEIEDLSEELQGKLLDTIESGTYRNIGSDEEKKTSFRLITAGQHSLESLLEMKKLRLDFYYRICNLHIHVPSLREHLEDIPDLVADFEKKNEISDCKIVDYQLLMHMDWKGNIRELLHYLNKIYMLN